MSTRQELHQLVDALPEDILPEAARCQSAIAAGLPFEIPEEDEEISPEEQAMIDASRAAIAQGDVVSHEEMLARRAARRSPS